MRPLKYWLIFTQGVALGWYVAALSGLRKKMYIRGGRTLQGG
jgi:hypothetical protein